MSGGPAILYLSDEPTNLVGYTYIFEVALTLVF